MLPRTSSRNVGGKLQSHEELESTPVSLVDLPTSLEAWFAVLAKRVDGSHRLLLHVCSYLGTLAAGPVLVSVYSCVLKDQRKHGEVEAVACVCFVCTLCS